MSAESTNTRKLSEEQNITFDKEYHSEEEISVKISYLKEKFEGRPINVLDIGGGNGAFLDRVLNELPGSQGVNFDISAELLERNKLRQSKRCINGDIDEINKYFSGEKYDVIFLNWVLHHLVGENYFESTNNSKKCLYRLSDLIMDGGVILVAENLYDGRFESDWPSRIIFGITSVKSPIVTKFVSKYANTSGVGVCFHSQSGWEKIFSQTGWKSDIINVGKPWQVSIFRRAMLMLRGIRHGHFALRKDG